MKKKYNKLGKIDPLDFCDVLAKVENSFNIKLDNESLAEATTFGELYDVIIDKIKLDHSDTCTTQHAFYLLRNAIANTTGIDKCSITPHTKLSKLFPRENRINAIEAIESELDFKINLLQPHKWVINLFGILGVVSFFVLFQYWLIGVAGILVSIAGFKLAGKLGKEMHVKTVGDLANKIARESYLKARRDNTVNKNEIEQKVIELFSSDLNLEPVVLKRTTNW
ncbi:MAG: hypothetical protein JST32_12995 [Bacteroidetes bacterium]|nr:hypothetical protein [Bacteroidota bacterium]